MRKRWPRESSSRSFRTCSRRTGWKGCSASDPRTRTIHGAIARMVRDPRAAQFTLAAESHAVPGVGVGGDAAADAGHYGDSVLSALHGTVSGCAVAGGGAAG